MTMFLTPGRVRLHEDVQVRGRVEGDTICGVKILGFASDNDRTYLPEAVRRAVPLYENAAVYLDHPAREPRNAVRSVKDRIGRLKNVRATDRGLYGDLVLNTGHPYANQVLWAARNDPSSLGLSHNAEGETERRGGKVVITAIKEVHSVDLVTEPATTKSLFEGVELTEARRFSDRLLGTRPARGLAAAAFAHALLS